MASSRQQYALVALFGLAVGAFGVTNTQGCSSKSQSLFDQDSGNGGGGAGGSNAGGGGGDIGGDDGSCFGACNGQSPDTGAGQCVGLQCNVNKNCAGGVHTTISGKVYAPAGTDGIPNVAAPGVPLYTVAVYVPTDP